MFKDLVVIVTGGAQGIGKGITLAYAQQGAKVVIADLNAGLGQQLEQDMLAQGYSALFVPTDVTKEQDIIHLMWQDLLQTNLTGSFFCAREAAKVMRHNAKGGSIVSLASTRAEMSEPHTEAYAATKGGIIALTHALARSLGPDQITVNCISPGWIETGDYEALRPIDHAQHLSGRVGLPEDIAQACLYLTNPMNNFVTGINLTVDGGMTKKMMYKA